MQVRSRIDQYYKPYHQELTRLLNNAIAQHGKVYLLDLHSFMGLITDDVCLGDANGTTCSEQLINAVAERFSQSGYGVVKNKVFSGGHITRHYGHQPNVEALQIELRYPTYMPAHLLSAQTVSAQTSPTQTDPAPSSRTTISNKDKQQSRQHKPTEPPAPIPIPDYSIVHQSPIFIEAQSKLKTLFSRLIADLS
ncbi:MAG: N-formylglutamate amidohydrolase [Cyanobacteria bacterium P01_D01_bin.105]